MKQESIYLRKTNIKSRFTLNMQLQICVVIIAKHAFTNSTSCNCHFEYLSIDVLITRRFSDKSEPSSTVKKRGNLTVHHFIT